MVYKIIYNINFSDDFKRNNIFLFFFLTLIKKFKLIKNFVSKLVDIHTYTVKFLPVNQTNARYKVE